jgi:hypothetical protein
MRPSFFAEACDLGSMKDLAGESLLETASQNEKRMNASRRNARLHVSESLRLAIH